ncbi:hypothetical protein ACNFR7_04205 [Streptomyces sp. RM1]
MSTARTPADRADVGVVPSSAGRVEVRSRVRALLADLGVETTG